MKIFINDNWNDQFIIDVHEFDNVGDIIGEIKKKNRYFRGQILIYKNIILNSKRFLKFYQISENSEIWSGPIGNYLKEDEIIVELFKSAFGGDIIHVIVKISETLSNIKSIIDKITESVYKIYDINGRKLDDNEIINNINCNGDNYYKLIICVEFESNNSFDDCCQIYDRYLIIDLLRGFLQYHFNTDINKVSSIIDLMKVELFYGLKFINIEGLFRYFAKYSHISGGMEKIGMEIWKEELDKAKQKIKINPSFDCCVPISFVNSRFLLWEKIFETVDKLIADFIHMLNEIFKKGHVYQLIGSMFISISIINYINNQLDFTNKSMKSVLIDILDFCENIFSQVNEKFEDFVEHFINLHTITKYNFSEIYSICQNYPRSNVYALPFHFEGKFRPIFPRNVKSILDAKKLISYYAKLPIEELYITNPKGNKVPNDEDEFDGMEYEIEFVYNMDEIKKLKVIGYGSFAKIILFQNNLTKGQFVVKCGSNLIRDISIQCRLKDSKNLLSYSELFNYNGQICPAMKYLSGGSISTYLKENELSEQQIAKWCYQILQQIDELHEKNIIHRDIKCDNIVLDEANNAYLIDFGLSKYIYKESNEQLLEKMKPSDIGTAHYVAPELFFDYIDSNETSSNAEISSNEINIWPFNTSVKFKKYSNKVDIWSFGVSVIEMVSEKKTYFEMNIYEAISRIKEIKTIEYKSTKPLSSELKQFIDFCIKWSPTERYSAKQLLESEFITNYLNK